MTLGELAAHHGLSLQVDDSSRATRDEGSGLQVSGVVLDNRAVLAGDLFAALPGTHTHGVRFAASAVEAGAVAILTDEGGLDQALACGVPVLVSASDRSLREVLAQLSAQVYGSPATALTTFGVTGTNGKTTTTFLLASLVELLGRRPGLVGTVELRVGGQVQASQMTTPESPDLQAIVATMVERGDTDLVMEVSSHAIELHRADALAFDVAAFTHLSSDHLDFHGDQEGYFAAKAKLFTAQRASQAVICVDEKWGQRLAAECEIPVTTLATGGEGDLIADWQVHDIVATASGSEFTLTGPAGEIRTSVALPGSFNVSNAALAMVCLLASGVTLSELEVVLARSDGLRASVPGRMEVVAQSPRCVVDFAHNADALERALAALRATTQGRLHVVFGATGERDTTKRAEMGRIAVLGADEVIITDDDPHGEDPALIRAGVLEGARAAQATAGGRGTVVHEIAPRAAAIAAAVANAALNDSVLIAGRGHETIQEVAGVNLELDDRVEVLAAIAAREGSS